MLPRRPLIAANWKMNHALAKAQEVLEGLLPLLPKELPDREVVVAPPFIVLQKAAQILYDTPVRLAAQNMHHETHGAYTGEISAAMLKSARCTHVILGHSERRQYFGETDDQIQLKVASALRANLVPILCVGETLEQRQNGHVFSVVSKQLESALRLKQKQDLSRVVIAYEPVWAIGTGETPTPEQAQEVHAALRKNMEGLADRLTADSVRIIYGGSVKPDNMGGLMEQSDIDGALVGGASLEAETFARIVRFR